VKIEVGVKVLRKHVALIGLGLALSVMIGMAFVTANMGNVVEVYVWIWPQWLTIDGYGYYRSQGFGEWVIAFVELPRDYSAKDVDLSSITLQVNGGSVPVSTYYSIWGRIIVAV
jgi:hypothetical protein